MNAENRTIGRFVNACNDECARVPHCLYKVCRDGITHRRMLRRHKSHVQHKNAQSVVVVAAAVRGGKVVICKGVCASKVIWTRFQVRVYCLKKFHGQSRWRCCWYWDNILTARIAYLYEHKWAALEFLCCCWNGFIGEWNWSHVNCINKVPPAEFIIWMDAIFCVCLSSKKMCIGEIP